MNFDHAVIRRLAAILIVLPLLALPSCFTTTLWGGGIEEEEEFNYETLQYETSYDAELGFSNVKSWKDLALCIVLTPFTLALDCLTYPIQAFLYGWEDEDCD